MSYDLKNFNIGKRIRELRKSKDFTIQELSDYLDKSKSCISKYESNEIKPNFETIVNICNCFNISIHEFLPPEQSKFLSLNPFASNILYIYYYTYNKIISSVIEISEELNQLSCSFYNGFKDITNYRNSCYSYRGKLEINNFGNTFFSFDSNSNQLLEKVLLIAKLPLFCQCHITKCVITGITPANEPVIKKGIISDRPLLNIEDYKKFFAFSSEELKEIKLKNNFILKNKDYDEFYYK